MNMFANFDGLKIKIQTYREPSYSVTTSEDFFENINKKGTTNICCSLNKDDIIYMDAEFEYEPDSDSYIVYSDN